jgi:hypothetical protein
MRASSSIPPWATPSDEAAKAPRQLREPSNGNHPLQPDRRRCGSDRRQLWVLSIVVVIPVLDELVSEEVNLNRERSEQLLQVESL